MKPNRVRDLLLAERMPVGANLPDIPAVTTRIAQVEQEITRCPDSRINSNTGFNALAKAKEGGNVG